MPEGVTCLDQDASGTTEKVHSMYVSRLLTGEDARRLVEEHLIKNDNDFLVVHLSTTGIQQNSLQVCIGPLHPAKH